MAYLLPVMQANLNQTPVRSLASKCPMELFLALPPASSLDVISRAEASDLLTEINPECVGDSLES
ncbi:hypothetical protein F442_08908 [Phytophthora nicotianae P10297]|uniref:Uncharacterized protein n=1 Tax=Phytophthora nicotianae P10297 TaxID=1317064 RepID=W2ZAT5_PHYNI|nr:hypothetical protein F442_08908 [Phytophthora nicotianae P10297]